MSTDAIPASKPADPLLYLGRDHFADREYLLTIWPDGSSDTRSADAELQPVALIAVNRKAVHSSTDCSRF